MRSSPRKPFTNDYFIFEVVFPLESFSEYIKIVNKLLNQEIEKARQRFEECENEIKKNIEKANHNELKGELWNEFVYGSIDEPAHHEYNIKSYYQSIYYSSILMSLYSFFERKLLYFCKTYEKDQTIKIKDLYGNGIDKSKKYIDKVLKIDLKSIDKEWVEIKKFNELRNFIVHNDQLVSGEHKDEKRIKKIKQIKGIEVVEKDNLISLRFIDSSFLSDFRHLIQKILFEVYNVKSVR